MINENWTDIHPDFAKKEDYRSKFNQQEWEEAGLTVEDAQVWITAGFKPSDSSDVKKWKKHKFAPQEAKQWAEAGLRPNFDIKFAIYLKKHNYTPEQLLDSKNKTAQEWLDYFYPPERKEICDLILRSKDLTGPLRMQGFDNLETLECNNNKITDLDVSECKKLRRSVKNCEVI